MDRFFDGQGSLQDLQISCINICNVRSANLVKIQGRLANTEDGKQIKVNIVTFMALENPNDLIGDLKFAKDSDVTVDFRRQMADERRQEIGNGMNIFASNNAVKIRIFGKK